MLIPISLGLLLGRGAFLYSTQTLSIISLRGHLNSRAHLDRPSQSSARLKCWLQAHTWYGEGRDRAVILHFLGCQYWLSVSLAAARLVRVAFVAARKGCCRDGSPSCEQVYLAASGVSKSNPFPHGSCTMFS
ncbi:hypothetical protein F4802DRAFT_547933 [Xylaria palmicola]|nr:hypothetical protein F4802DRAFT_547933 [Xylaria palmicola]